MRVEQARRVVNAIIKDLTQRRGLRQEWEQIDAGIRKEIKAEWIGIAMKATISQT